MNKKELAKNNFRNIINYLTNKGIDFVIPDTNIKSEFVRSIYIPIEGYDKQQIRISNHIYKRRSENKINHNINIYAIYKGKKINGWDIKREIKKVEDKLKKKEVRLETILEEKINLLIEKIGNDKFDKFIENQTLYNNWTTMRLRSKINSIENLLK